MKKVKTKKRKRKGISISLKPRLMNKSSHLGKAKERNLTARVVGKTKLRSFHSLVLGE